MGHEPHRLPLVHDPAYIAQLSIPFDCKTAIIFSHTFFAVNLYKINHTYDPHGSVDTHF